MDFQDRVTLLHLKDGHVLKTPYTLKYWIDKLSDKGFSQPYRSYVVNLYQVSGFSKDKKDLVLLNDEKYQFLNILEKVLKKIIISF